MLSTPMATPIGLKLREDQAPDGKSNADMLDHIGPSRIRLADRAYLLDLHARKFGSKLCFDPIQPLIDPADDSRFAPIPINPTIVSADPKRTSKHPL